MSGARALWAAALLTLAAASAAAQLPGPPLRILPPASLTPGRTPPTRPPEIEETPLGAVDTAWLGPWREVDGGLPATLWRGSSRARVAAILPQLAPSTSPAIQDLERRLLLSDALAPEGADPAEGPSLAALRLDRLFALGFIDGGQKWLAMAQARPKSESEARQRVELLFAADDVKLACGEVDAAIVRFLDPWWDRALVACEALGGEREKAALGLSILHERKAPVDPAYEALVTAVLDGHPRKLDKLGEASPLLLALLAQTKSPLPADALTAAGPAALFAWADCALLPADLRLAAAERAAMAGALSLEALTALYDTLDVKPEELATVGKDGQPPADARRRALLYLAARSGATPLARAAAMAALLAEAKGRGSFAFAARLVAPILAELSPPSAPPGFAADAARALLADRRADAAQPWIAIAKRPELRLLARLAAAPASDADAGPLLRDAIAAIAARNAAAAPHVAELLLALLGALGEPLVELDWTPYLVPPHRALVPSAALWSEAGDAARGGRVGETALTAAILAADGGGITGEPIVLARAIAGLRAAGLEADARALAVEAALAAGL